MANSTDWTPSTTPSTDWTKPTVVSTNWGIGDPNAFNGYLLLEDGTSLLLLEDGGYLGIEYSTF